MMWNNQYGHMGGMMNRDRGANWHGDPDQMIITAEQAVRMVQEYQILNGKDWFVENHAETLYGCYTLHVVDTYNEIIGMLRVNRMDGDVFLHTRHGEFLDRIGFPGNNESYL